MSGNSTPTKVDLDFQLTNRELRWLNGLSTLMQSLGQTAAPGGCYRCLWATVTFEFSTRHGVHGGPQGGVGGSDTKPTDCHRMREDDTEMVQIDIVLESSLRSSTL